jgi:excinuclease ABC subunit A
MIKEFDSNISEFGDYADEITEITIKGGREHNLKNIDLIIPRDSLTVITGLSGSGKSTLAFDTLYAEANRRYVECLSPYAKQFLGMMQKPEVDIIEGLSPAISIEQKSISHNPRSTVGTATEIYDYMRLLFAKIGVQHCVRCDIPAIKRTVEDIIQTILTEYQDKRIQILAPIIKSRKGHYRELFELLTKQGFTKVRVDKKIRDLVVGMKLERYNIHDIELVIDRCLVNTYHVNRIRESVELALSRGEGNLIILSETNTDEFIEVLYSTKYSCPNCGESYEEPAPNMFSFNSPNGACATCQGLGEIKDFNLPAILENTKLSIYDGAIAPLGKKSLSWLWTQLDVYAEKHGIDLSIAMEHLEHNKLNMILYGNEDSIELEHDFERTGLKYKHKFLGVLPTLKHIYENPTTYNQKKNIEPYLTDIKCPTCKSGRLKKETLQIKLYGSNIKELCDLDLSDLRISIKEIEKKLNDREILISHLIFKEINNRLSFLENVGLAYIHLNRPLRTLSGGESQRIRLASQIGSQLVGVLYVLDEPSIGLHQHDNNRLINSLKELRDLGNSVIVVEHDKAMIESGDHIVDIGPGAGIHGGEIIFSGTMKEMNKLSTKALKNSLTAQYLLNIKSITIPAERRKGNGKYIILQGATGNNLKSVTLKIPLGTFVCITGMSGSGKSSLINDTLYPILSRYLNKNSSSVPLPYSSVDGIDNIDKIIEIDQSPIGRTPRSNPATYTGLFTLIRDHFAELREAKIRGYKSGRFSFNVEGGRCEECQGAGIKKIEMNFLPDVYVTCDECKGQRYNSETLQVKFKGKSIADVLNMTVEEANEFFTDIPKLKKKIKTMFEVGLGYIKLGQQAPTLSGGEAQRVKLSAELSKVSTGKTLYLLDEPTTGLHFEDINMLLAMLHKLADKGNTVVVIEHNLDVVKNADWIIDLGPEGGKFGGQIIAEGTPESIIKKKKSLTAKYLKEEMKQK